MVTELQIDAWLLHSRRFWIGVTTNGFVKKNGACVMGRGIAYQCARRFPRIPFELGHKIRKYGNHPFAFPEYQLITFPTKHVWWDKSDLELIEQSLVELIQIIDQLKLPIFYLPRPGCSNGKLDWEFQVKPILEKYEDKRIVIISKQIS